MSHHPTIAIIYMGGTFGCVGEPLSPMAAEQFLEHLKSLDISVNCQFFVAPTVKDSSCYTAQDWLKLARFILHLIQQHSFHQFVILHGTDTLSYASAMLNRFLVTDATLILTGSQLPLLDVHGQMVRAKTDALINLHFAIKCAIEQPSGVYLAFAQQCIPQGQALKLKTHDFDAFIPQARISQLNTQHTQQQMQNSIFHFDHYLQSVHQCNILNLMLQPISIQQLNQQLQHLCHNAPDFLILQGYGVGNFAVDDVFLDLLQQLKQHHCLVILSSQVPLGTLTQHYAVNTWIQQADICLDNTQSYADLYAKCIQFYLQFETYQQRFEQWNYY